MSFAYIPRTKHPPSKPGNNSLWRGGIRLLERLQLLPSKLVEDAGEEAACSMLRWIQRDPEKLTVCFSRSRLQHVFGGPRVLLWIQRASCLGESWGRLRLKIQSAACCDGPRCNTLWWTQGATRFGGPRVQHALVDPGCNTLWWTQGATRFGGSRVQHALVDPGCNTLWWTQGATRFGGSRVQQAPLDVV